MQRLTSVVDASAVLAVCKQEAGADIARHKMRGGLISAVNVSEVIYKAATVGKRTIAEAIIHTAELSIVAFDYRQAVIAADLAGRTKNRGVSFADRACLALALAENLPVLTADQLWVELGLELEIDLFRPKAN